MEKYLKMMFDAIILTTTAASIANKQKFNTGGIVPSNTEAEKLKLERLYQKEELKIRRKLKLIEIENNKSD